MGFKSTVTLSRTDAENRYADLIVQTGNPHYFIFKYLQNIEDTDLEDMLMEMNDQAAGGEGFENYRIEVEE